jgi:hypothetical protein
MRKPSKFMLGVSFFVLAASASATGDRVGPVSVKSAGSNLAVRVTGPTTLRAVLEAVCEHAEARCELQAGAAEVPVQAGEFAGTWSQVVDELLKDSGISYAATPQAPGRAAYLFVEGPSVSRSSRAADVDRTGGGGGSAAAADEAALPEPEPADIAQGADVPDNATISDSAPDATPAAASGPSGGPLIVDAAAAAAALAGGGQGLAMTPFSNAQGQPILARTTNNQAALAAAGGAPGWAVLPFSDASGNPLVVQVTNPPLDVTPFAGPNGEPWPAPPPQPSQKLEYPIPPTPRTTAKAENP